MHLNCEIKRRIARSQHYRLLACHCVSSSFPNHASSVVFWQRRPVSVHRAKAVCFFQYPTANIYLTTSWRVCGGGTEACTNRAFQAPARLFLTAVDGCCNFDGGRRGKTKSNSHFSYAPGAQIRKTFSQNWLSHYGTISKSSSDRVQAEAIWVEGPGLRCRIMAEIHLPGWRRGGVKKEPAFYLFLFWLLKQMVPYMQSGSVC